jgi:hypothetical protein
MVPEAADVQDTGLTFGNGGVNSSDIVAMRVLTSGATVQKVYGDLGCESATAFIVMFKKALKRH